jgi:predicted AAA+ superfamily ATPase
MFTRVLKLPNQSFFLFGPRGTGKSSWLKKALPDACWYDLLLEKEFLKLLSSPDVLIQEVSALAEKGNLWVVIDEIQRLPKLLNSVHSLIFKYEQRVSFALSGSSARKLKRNEANLLAGRAVNRLMFPLTMREMEYAIALENILRYGGLPRIATLVNDGDISTARDVLESYVVTYLREEIQQEALTRSLDSFARFLRIAAVMNGQIVSFTQTASDAAVARQTVTGYFEVLCDTLLGILLPSWQPRAKVRESAHPKFYFFDPGVVRALSGRLHEPIDSVERGRLFETWILHELRAWIGYSRSGGELFYWRTAGGIEVDFIWQRGDKVIAFEVKSGQDWRPAFSKSLKNLCAAAKITAAYGIYDGERERLDEPVHVLPVKQFLEELWAGEIFC